MNQDLVLKKKAWGGGGSFVTIHTKARIMEFYLENPDLKIETIAAIFGVSKTIVNQVSEAYFKRPNPLNETIVLVLESKV